jgi:DNA polymerase-3 subunit delta'
VSGNIWGFEGVSFREIIGHRRPLEILRKAMLRGRLAHAYLFTGPDGVGKRTTALKFAKAVLCGKGDGDSCGECSSCLKMEGLNHPDLLVVEPRGGQILVDQVREVQDRVLFRPLEGEARMIILDSAHNLNPQASNALLKILEEPPRGNIFVLVASSESSLLPTIVSRCQRLYFGPLMDHEVMGFLVKRLGWEEERAREVARQARGSISAALELGDKPLRAWKEEARRILEMGRDEKSSPLLNLASAWSKERKETMERLECLRMEIREALVQEARRRPTDSGPREIRARRVEELLWMWRESGKTIQALERNMNVQLAMEELLIRFHEIKSSGKRSLYLTWIRRS